MTLSVCCLTGDDGPRVAALLGLLRPLADEIVVAADARVDEERLRHYAGVADQVQKIEFDVLERHLGWLHAQCSGDWILRIDADEVPSAALLERLPELARARDVEQVWIPRRWLFPDTGHWLDEVPWSVDHQLRLVRNDGLLRFPGTLHSSAAPVRPARYIEEPLYHLVDAIEPAEQREGRALRYEVIQPRRLAAGGAPLNEAFYLPERHATTPPATVPEADRQLIEQVLAGAPAPEAAVDLGAIPLVTRAENDRWWAGRAVPESAYAAQVVALQDPIRMYAGERREILFRITNTGTERWSWDPDLPPHFRAGYRWHAVGTPEPSAEGERTAFPHDVAPGETAIVPLVVQAPAEAGQHDLTAGVLHEGVRWVEPLARVRAHVTKAPHLDTVERPGARGGRGVLRRLRTPRLEIPRIIHRVWLGPNEMPAHYQRYGETWREHHPGWEMRLWTDDNLPPLRAQSAFERSRNYSEQSDILRYEVLRQFGGVYVDTDVECLRPVDDLLAGVKAFAAWEVPGRMCGAVLGGVAGHPLFEQACDLVDHTVGHGPMPNSTGPVFLTILAERRDDVTVFSPEKFYPYLWDVPEEPPGPFPDSWAVHHWAGKWEG